MVVVDGSYYIFLSLVWRIGCVVVGVEGSLGCEMLISLGVFGLSVKIAVYFIGTREFFAGAISSNLNFR